MPHDRSLRPTVVAVILAGGAGRRFDDASGKLGALVDGVPLLARVISATERAGLEAVVVTKSGRSLPPLADRVRVITEPDTPQHPLVGVVAALDALPSAQAVVAIAGDLPFLEPMLLRALADAREPSVCVDVTGATQPLLARYARTHRDALADAAASGVPARTLARRIGLQPLRIADYDPEERSLVNVNTTDELRAAEVGARSRA